MSPSPESVPSAVRWLVRTLEEAGHETWAVGGVVRDALLELPLGDWDFATRARPGEVRRIFRRTVPIGIEHGTIGVLARNGTMYEVTTFRRDVETDGRHAVVEFADTLEEDLARRDFTFNAIAWHPLHDELRDPFDGRADLASGTLRTVGAAADRFAEDYLRVLRALRFASRFGMRIEPSTWEALTGAVGHLTKLSAERLRDELLKTLAADSTPSVALELYRESRALDVLYPELARLSAATPREWEAVIASLDALPRGRPLLRLAALLRTLEPPAAAAVLMRLRLSNAEVDETARRAAAEPLPGPEEPDAVHRRWLSRHGVERVGPLARIELAAARAAAVGGTAADPAAVVASWRRARRVARARPPLAVSDLAIGGRDLIRMGLEPGPGIGTALDELLAWVIEDPERNERAALEGRLRELLAGGIGSGG